MTLIYARARLSIEKTSSSYPSPFWNLKVSSGDDDDSDDEGTDGNNHGNVVDDGVAEMLMLLMNHVMRITVRTIITT